MIPEERIEEALRLALEAGLDRDSIETVVREYLDEYEEVNVV